MFSASSQCSHGALSMASCAVPLLTPAEDGDKGMEATVLYRPWPALLSQIMYYTKPQALVALTISGLQSTQASEKCLTALQLSTAT